MRKFAGIAVVFFFFAGAACAQVPKGNVYFGYTLSRIDVPGGTKNLYGGEGSLEWKVFPWIGAVADFSGVYGTFNTGVCVVSVSGQCIFQPTDVRRYTYMFGPRISIHIKRFTPFANALFGAAHINNQGNTDNSFASAFGGGIDYRLIRGIAWRVQGDYLRTKFFNVSGNNLRVSTGIDFRF